MSRPLALFVALLAHFSTSGATLTWTGQVNNLWSNPGNWSTGSVPTTGDRLVFPLNSSPSTNDLASGMVFDSIVLHARPSVPFGIPAYGISGNAIGLTNGMLGEGWFVWGIPVVLQSSQTFTFTGLAGIGDIDLNGHDLTVFGGSSATEFGSAPTSLDQVRGVGSLRVANVSLRGIGITGTTYIDGEVFIVGPEPLAILVVDGRLRGVFGVGNVTVNGTLSPGLTFSTNPVGLLSTKTLTLNNGSTAEIEIYGPGVFRGQDQISVDGVVTISPGARLDVKTRPFSGAAGDVFTIIRNDGNGPVSGFFSGLPEGALLRTNNFIFAVSYRGGDGNDVTLTIVSNNAIPTLSEWSRILLVLTLAAVAVTSLHLHRHA